MDIKQKAREMFDKCSILIDWKEEPEIADILQKISDNAFEKQKAVVYPLLDQIIDLAIAEDRQRIVQIIHEWKQKGFEVETLIDRVNIMGLEDKLDFK